MGHIMTLRIFVTPKSYIFGETTKRCLIDLTPIDWAELKKSYMRSHVKCKGFYLTRVKKKDRQSLGLKLFKSQT